MWSRFVRLLLLLCWWALGSAVNYTVKVRSSGISNDNCMNVVSQCARVTDALRSALLQGIRGNDQDFLIIEIETGTFDLPMFAMYPLYTSAYNYNVTTVPFKKIVIRGSGASLTRLTYSDNSNPNSSPLQFSFGDFPLGFTYLEFSNLMLWNVRKFINIPYSNMTVQISNISAQWCFRLFSAVAGSLYISSSTFSGSFQNDPVENSGSVVYASGTFSLLSVSQSNFTQNSVQNSGGVFWISTNKLAQVSFSKCRFEGNFAGVFGAVIFCASACNFTSSSLIFSNNQANAGSANINSGGGLLSFASGSTITVTSSYFSQNYCLYGCSGGAIWTSSRSIVALTNSTFVENAAGQFLEIEGNGGAIFCGSQCNLISKNCLFTVNNVGGGFGGAIYVGSNSSVLISNSNFNNNFASDKEENSVFGSGGALYISENSTASIQSVQFYGNSVVSKNGGAIYVSSQSILAIAFSSFLNNSGGMFSQGAAIYASPFVANMNLFSCNFSGNVAFEGGAIFAERSEGFSIQSSNFVLNSAQRGGAISSKAPVFVSSSKFYQNSAVGNGGAIYIAGDSRYDRIRSSFSLCEALFNSASNGGFMQIIHSDLTVQRNKISNNQALNFGGAVFTEDSSISSQLSVFSNNKAQTGGAIYASLGIQLSDTILKNNSASATVSKCVDAAGSGGALFISIMSVSELNVQDFTSRFSFQRTSFEDNLASNFGGAIAVSQSTPAFIRYLQSLGLESFRNNNATSHGASLGTPLNSLHVDTNYPILNRQVLTGLNIPLIFEDGFSSKMNSESCSIMFSISFNKNIVPDSQQLSIQIVEGYSVLRPIFKISQDASINQLRSKNPFESFNFTITASENTNISTVFRFTGNICVNNSNIQSEVQLGDHLSCLCPTGYYSPPADPSSACTLCPKGRFTNSEGSLSCQFCSSGKSSFSGSSTCMNCLLGEYISASGCTSCSIRKTTISTYSFEEECICKAGFLTNLQNKTICNDCPDGAVCNTLNMTSISNLYDGYWLDTSNPLRPITCIPSQACIHGTCSEGYTGMACSSCDLGYYRLSKTCFRCPGASKSYIPLVVIAALVGSYLVLMTAYPSPTKAHSPNIIITWIQIIAIFASMPLQWPSTVTSVYSVFSFINFNLSVLAPECSLAVNYWAIWTLKLLFPIFAGVIFGLFWLIDLAFKKLNRTTESIFTKPLAELLSCNRIRIRTSRSSRLISDHFSQTRHIYALVQMMNLLYILAVSTTLDVFNCVPREDNTLVMLNNPSLKCFSEEWNNRMPSVIISMIFYVFGIPCILFLILWSGRNGRRHDSWYVYRYGSLILPYHDRFYWWEMVNLLRRLLLSLTVGFYGVMSTVYLQLFITISILFLLLFAQVILNPYRKKLNNILSFTWAVVALIALFSGVIYPSSVVSNSDKELFGGVVVAALTIELVVSLSIMLTEFSNSRKSRIQESISQNDFFTTERERKQQLLKLFPQSHQIIWNAMCNEDAYIQTLFFRELLPNSK